jgi:hypothetical protein
MDYPTFEADEDILTYTASDRARLLPTSVQDRSAYHIPIAIS